MTADHPREVADAIWEARAWWRANGGCDLDRDDGRAPRASRLPGGQTGPMFEGFRSELVDVGRTSLFVRHAGAGPPVLLLHGHPRTSATWHAVAPDLVDRGFAVVCADLPGYGRSGKPAPAPDHAPHSKRAAANDLVALMSELGHERFAVVGHDRGSYVGLRMALDHPRAISRAALLDCIPISEHLARADATFASRWWHWFFFAQPETPERVINADPDSWYSGDADAMGAENYAEFRDATRDPAVVRGMLEDYRAGLTIDREHEDADKSAGRKVGCPLLTVRMGSGASAPRV